MTSIITHEIEERYPYPDNGERPVTQTRPATRSTRRTPDMYRGTITLALLRWIGHLEQFSQITNQQDKDDA